MSKYQNVEHELLAMFFVLTGTLTFAVGIVWAVVFMVRWLVFP